MRSKTAALLLSCVLCGVALFAACSNQAEGQHCDPRFGNEDCMDGLVCKRATELGGAYDLCCPQNGANVVECRRSISTDGGDTPAPDAQAGDATTDSSTDATVEASIDAGNDSSSDGSSDAMLDGADSGDQ